MSLIIPLVEIKEKDREQVGGKSLSLSVLSQIGMNVPGALCVKAAAYHRFITCTGLRERILLEINRKNFKEMRWEEMWDASLRIRNMFLKTTVPPEIAEELRPMIEEKFKNTAVVGRPHPVRTPPKPPLQGFVFRRIGPATQGVSPGVPECQPGEHRCPAPVRKAGLSGCV